MAITKALLNSSLGFAQRNPLVTLGLAAALVIGSIVAGAAVITGIRYNLEDRKIEKMEKKTEEATTGMKGEISDADKAAQERAIEDAIRERTIKPEIQRTTRNLEEARSRTRAARNDYEKARKTNDLGNDSDPRALHERNCAELRELYPGEPIPLCDQ